MVARDEIAITEIICLEFSVCDVAHALKIPEDVVVHEFKDGRVASRFTEHWAAQVFAFKKSENTNAPQDGKIELQHLPESGNISVKTLTEHGVKFQRSRNIGSGRVCTIDDLVEAVKSADLYIVADVTEFPSVKLVPVRSTIILGWVYDGFLTPAGIRAKEFYRLLKKGRQLRFVKKGG